MLAQGALGADVSAWQVFLNNQGHPTFGVDGDFGGNTTKATKAFQAKRGLPQSGSLDTATEEAAKALGFLPRQAIAAAIGPGMASETWPPRPAALQPPTPAAQDTVFGPLLGHYQGVSSYNGDPSHDDAITITNGFASNIVRVTVPQLADVPGAGGGRIAWHREAVPQLLGMFAAWERAGLLGRVLTFAGSWVPRLVRWTDTSRPKPPWNQRSLSNHAFGVAFDINVPQNGLGKLPALVGTRGSVRELVPIANRYGFYWGGHFTRLDGMHFEVARRMSQAEVDAAGA